MPEPTASEDAGPMGNASDLHVHDKTAGQDAEAMESGVSEPAVTAQAAAAEGTTRLDRSWRDLFATGVVGGVDVSVGVIALILLTHGTGNAVIGSLGFAIGFVALALAGSELITENFLVPVATVIEGRRPARALVRLWGGTLVANLVGGGAVMVVFAFGWPDEIVAAVEFGQRSIVTELTFASLAPAIIAGLLITLMTWMQQGVRQSVGGRVLAAAVVGFLIAYSHSDHVVVVSFEVMLGILSGMAPYGWDDLLVSIPWWLFGNLLGGLGLVTVVRLIQARN